MAAGMAGMDLPPTPRPPQPAACVLPLAYLPGPLMQTNLRPGHRTEEERLVLERGDLGWHWGSSARRWGDREPDTERATGTPRDGGGVWGWGGGEEPRDSETETVRRRETQIGKGWIAHLNLKSREDTEKK